MLGEATVEDGVAVGFGGAVLEERGERREEVCCFVNERFGSLFDEEFRGCGTGGGRGGGHRGGERQWWW